MLLPRWSAGLFGCVLFGGAIPALAQIEAIEDAVEVIEEVFEGPRAVPLPGRPVRPGAPKTEENAKVEGEDSEPEPVRKPKEPLPPRHMVLKLQDGSVIAGDLTVNEIKVETEFGELTVPISKIKKFTPGLDSNPKAGEELKTKLKELESDDYKTREQAHKDLAAMGPKISKQLAPHLQSENAEVKRHVSEIMKEFEQMAEESSEDDEGDSKSQQAWIDEDTVETTDFTVIGKISPPKFEIGSKYGPLTVALGEIIHASRPVDSRESIRKSLSVAGTNLVQRSFKTTGIKLQAGDRVTITASGNLTMTPWGGNAVSGPDGTPNYGWYVAGSVPAGALVYRVGDKGQIQKAGSRVTFTAKSSGTLQLAIGMMPEYANEGYNFPGEYKARIKVDPQ